MRRLVIADSPNGCLTGILPGKKGLPELGEYIYVLNWQSGDVFQYNVCQVYLQSMTYDAMFDRFVVTVELPLEIKGVKDEQKV